MAVESIGDKFAQELEICLGNESFVRVDEETIAPIRGELNSQGMFPKSGKTYRIVVQPKDYDNSSRIVDINISDELRTNLLQEITQVMRLQNEIQSLNQFNLTQKYGFFDFSLNFYIAPLCSKYLGAVDPRKRPGVGTHFTWIYSGDGRGVPVRRQRQLGIAHGRFDGH